MRKAIFGVALLTLGIAALDPVVQSAEPQPTAVDAADIKALLQRLEALEKRNGELEKTIQQVDKLEQRNGELEKAIQQLQPTPASTQEGQEGPRPGANVDNAVIRDIVKDYLKGETDKKKAQEEAKTKATEVEGFEVGKDLKFSARWRDGFHAETADKAFKFYVGGRVDFDNSWYSAAHSVVNSIGQFNNFADPNQGLADGSEFRRARLRFQATAWEVCEFETEFDFANYIDLRRRALGIAPGATANLTNDFEPTPGVRFTDVWFGINELPWIGTFRAGHQKEWVTFTNATSDRFLTFIERPLLFDAFNNDFQFSNGFTVQRTFLDQRSYAWFGIFRTNSNFGASDVGDGDYAFDARLTALPLWRDDGDQWVHVGIDYSGRSLHLDQTRFRARTLVQAGESFQVPNIVNTGTLFSRDGEQLVNFEFASAWGPFTVTSEATFVWVPNAYTGGLPRANGSLPAGVVRRGDYNANGCYVEALYFLTGEHREYRKERPSYDRVRPISNFYAVRGPHGIISAPGAWEIGIRYDYLDLTHGGINGGTYNALTLGLNWHLNPTMRVQWNYVYATRDFEPTNAADRQEGNFNSFGMRFHWDW